jgi:predicted transcriptional regulator
MKHRTRTDIIADMLESASDKPLTKTQLMYMAYVPHEQMRSFVAMLIESDLLNFSNQTHQFNTTAKGRKFLELYDEMHQCVNLTGLFE